MPLLAFSGGLDRPRDNVRYAHRYPVGDNGRRGARCYPWDGQYARRSWGPGGEASQREAALPAPGKRAEAGAYPWPGETRVLACSRGPGNSQFARRSKSAVDDKRPRLTLSRGMDCSMVDDARH